MSLTFGFRGYLQNCNFMSLTLFPCLAIIHIARTNYFSRKIIYLIKMPLRDTSNTNSVLRVSLFCLKPVLKELDLFDILDTYEARLITKKFLSQMALKK